ncbi:MAG: hypothetical protein N3A38_10205, partial [Planctomycetota bacterium]|nr:hypothetical protein [Planctomycetota bacterium]
MKAARTVQRLVAAWAVLALDAGGGTVAFRLEAGESHLPKVSVAPAPGQDAGSYTDILNENSLWRWCDSGGDPWVRTTDGKLVRRKLGGKTAWGDQPNSSPLPPADWAGVDFDDSGWVRCRASNYGVAYELKPMFGTTMIAVRGKFEVRDPARAGELELSLTYSGGVVVYMNGKEVAKGHIPGDKPGLDAPAEDHPIEAMVTPDGKQWLTRGSKAQAAQLALRERKLDVKIAPQFLRRGANVLAIANRASPLLEATLKARGEYENAPWTPVGILGLRLKAPPGSVVVPNTARPAGIQVWNCMPWDTIDVFSYGDPQEPLRPITIHGARNGTFSGRLMVSSGQEIRGLKVTVTDLMHAGRSGRIPASAVRVRCAQPWVPGEFAYNHPGRRDGFDGLADGVPATVAADPNKV